MIAKAEPKWLSRNDYIEKYASLLGVGPTSIARLISQRKVQVMHRPYKGGKLVKNHDGYEWPENGSGNQIAVRNIAPDIKPIYARVKCVECRKPVYNSRGNYVDFNGVCVKCRKDRKRLVHEMVCQSDAARALYEYRQSAAGESFRESNDPDLASLREKRIQAHAKRIEAMGLAGNGEDWND